MTTDDLIRVMAADTARPQPLTTSLMRGLIPALAVASAVVATQLGFREDLAAALLTPLLAMRTLLVAALGLVAIGCAQDLMRPEGRDSVRLWPLAGIGAVALGLLAWAWVTTPADMRERALLGETLATCLVMIPLLSILPVAAVLMTLRRGATTAPALAGFVAGLAGSGLAAAIYSLHCPENSPLFCVTWYGLAILSTAAVSAALGARLLRW